jgi:hypothetical protein
LLSLLRVLAFTIQPPEGQGLKGIRSRRFWARTLAYLSSICKGKNMFSWSRLALTWSPPCDKDVPLDA